MNRALRKAVLREPTAARNVVQASLMLVCMGIVTIGVLIFIITEGNGRPFYDIPWTIIAIAVTVGVLALGVAKVYQRALAGAIINRRLADRHCPWCGYDTSTLKVDLCPECGRPRHAHMLRP